MRHGFGETTALFYGGLKDFASISLFGIEMEMATGQISENLRNIRLHYQQMQKR